MTDTDLDRYAGRIVRAVSSPDCYARANAAIARERAKQAPAGLLGGLELPCYIQDRIRSWPSN